ncbi:hypothetical protein C4564_01405 [Candidatus Microgenomates bacterium]|nr:MAG: hypothetical protein C4564_01405 [Candidatus Microgenomates bacterium]
MCIQVPVVTGQLSRARTVFKLFEGVKITESGLSVYESPYVLVCDTMGGEVVVYQPTTEAFVLGLHNMVSKNGNGLRIDEQRAGGQNMIIIPSIFACVLVITTERRS